MSIPGISDSYVLDVCYLVVPLEFSIFFTWLKRGFFITIIKEYIVGGLILS